VDAAQAKVDQTKAEEAVRLSQLQDYAVQAYVNGGSSDPLPVLLNSDDSNTVGQRTGYLKAAVGDRQQLIDALNASEQDLSTQIAQLGAAQDKAQSVTNDLAARKSSADAAVKQQTQLLSSVKGQLAQLVQQEQARRAQASAAAAARAAA